MKKQTKPNWQKQMVFAAIATVVIMLGASSVITAQGKFKPGDRVECDMVGIGDYLKGTVVPYLEKDNPVFKGEYYLTRVMIDRWKDYTEGVLCQTKQVRLLAGVAAPPLKDQDQNAVQPLEGANPANQAGPKYKPGDRVECDTVGINKTWFKGTVLPYLETDHPGKDFETHRVRFDSDGTYRPEGGMCFTKRMRLLTGAAAAPPPVDTSVGKATVDENNTLSADRLILVCPVQQTQVKNGARPNAELLKKIIRCNKGEKPASKGYDGAVTIDVTALQIGAPRPWSYRLDSGNGKASTTVYPVKATYTEKTFYRHRTTVGANWIRILNFYVNAFGEWQIGSEEHVKSPDSKDVLR